MPESDPRRPTPLVSVDPSRVVAVIVALNEERYIEGCVRALLEGDARTSKVRLLVVDGGSTDETRNIVRGLIPEFPQLVLLDNPAQLQSAAVNLAARAVAGDCDILVRCDAPCFYPAGYVMAVADSLVRHVAQSLVVTMDAVGSGAFQRANAWIVNTPLGSGGAAHRAGRRSGYVDHGHHAGFQLDWFLRVGGYDETFTHNEDAEYDYRCREAGGRIYLDSSVRIAYYPRATCTALWKQYRAYGCGRARNLRKHDALPALRQMIPVANFLLLGASATLMPFTSLGFIWPGLYALVLCAASAWMVVRHRSPVGLWSGVALGIMHNSWAIGFLTRWLSSRGPKHERHEVPRTALNAQARP